MGFRLHGALRKRPLKKILFSTKSYICVYFYPYVYKRKTSFGLNWALEMANCPGSKLLASTLKKQEDCETSSWREFCTSSVLHRSVCLGFIFLFRV